MPVTLISCKYVTEVLQYYNPNFQIWSELRRPGVGAVNFFTGMGGFLQALIFGYAGLSIHLDRLEFNRPQLPPEANNFKIRGELQNNLSKLVNTFRYC